MSTSSSGTVTDARMDFAGGCNVTYDLTGCNSEFLRSAQYIHYKGASDEMEEASSTDCDQIIELPVPAFLKNSRDGGMGITVYKITDTVDDTTAAADREEIPYIPKPELSDEVYWNYVEEDQTAMGKAYLLWNDAEKAFSGLLCRKIKVHIEKVNNAKVCLQVLYQAFYKDAVDTAAFHSERGPQYTRELGKHLIDSIDELKARTELLSRNMFGSTTDAADILPEDLTAQTLENRVTNELHTLSTAAGQTLLSPARGSFYPGVAGSRTEFELYKCFYFTLTSALTTEYIGWLFVYDDNLTRVYIPVSTEQFGTAFNDSYPYYYIDNLGRYVRMNRGTEEEVSRGEADYYVGMFYDDFMMFRMLNSGTFTEGVTYYKYVTSPTGGSYQIATAGTDYTIGQLIPPGRFYLKENTEIYVLKYSSAQDINFTSTVNDTSAVITREKRVILTADNLSKYSNFYGKLVDIKLTNPKSKKLVLGTDYTFNSVNIPKTERTYTDQAVYDNVRMLTDIEDEDLMLCLNYQAFGGQVMPDDIRDIRKDLINAMAILGEHQLLTVANLTKQPAMQDLLSRVRRMEEYHNHFTQVDHLVYKGSSGFHWINVATLYDLDWFEDLGDTPIKEIGTFRISSRDQRWCYEFTATVDLSKPEEDCLTVKTLGATGTDLNNLEEWKNLPTKERIGVRLCWNNDGRQSGAVLQIGWDFDNYNYNPDTVTWDTDTVTVTNKSGHTSFFRLYSNPLEITKDADASISVYGHVVYVPFQGTIQSGVPYFECVEEYMYYQTGSVRIQSGVTYYKKEESTGTYMADNTVYPGQLVSSIAYPVYERSAYQKIYRRAEVTPGDVKTYADGLYTVDDEDSFSDYSFTFINQKELWDHVNHPTVSKCSTMYLEDNSGGLTIWMGNYPLRAFSFGPKQTSSKLKLHCSLSPSDQNIFNADRIKDAIVLFYDRKTPDNRLTGRYFSATLPMCSTATEGQEAFGDGIWFMEDLCGMSLRIYDSDRSRYTYIALDDDSKMVEGKAYYLKTGSGTIADPYVYTKIGNYVPTKKYFNSGVASVPTKYYRKYKTTTNDLNYQDGKAYYRFDKKGVEGKTVTQYVKMTAIEGGTPTKYQYIVGGAIPVSTVEIDMVYDGRDRYMYLGGVVDETTYTAEFNNYDYPYAWYVGHPTKAEYVKGGPAYIVQVNAVYDIELEVGMGTSSWINDRFDLRQIKIHF